MTIVESIEPIRRYTDTWDDSYQNLLSSVSQASKTTAGRPNLRIIEPNMQYYEEILNDALSIRGFQEYRANDYHLGT